MFVWYHVPRVPALGAVVFVAQAFSVGSGVMGPHSCEKSECAHRSLLRWKELDSEQDLPAACCGLSQPHTSDQSRECAHVPAACACGGCSSNAVTAPSPCAGHTGQKRMHSTGEKKRCAEHFCLEMHRATIHLIPTTGQLFLHA